MARQLLRGDVPVEDDWKIVEQTDLAPEALPRQPVICPAPYWLAHRPALVGRPYPTAVWLDSHEEPDAIVPHLQRLALVAIRFPTFNDGRALSLAVLLRSRHRFTGELRAIGAVHEDLIHYMRRCGIDSFLLRSDGNVDVARRNYHAMSDFYQGSVIEPRPWFRRRADSVEAVVTR
jgi:uncharacterized protein (DUF934 family)